MIAFLEGVVAAKTPSSLYLNVGGVGYQIFMSQAALSKVPASGEPFRALTHMHVTDSGIALYGFLSEEEKALFEKLIGVSGVGPKVALAALSTFSPRALADAVAAQDTALVAKIPGVGKKTASRIVLELKGSLDTDMGTLFSPEDAGSVLDARRQAATEALLGMGFTGAEAEVALKGAPEGATEAQLLQYALKRLGS